MKKSSLVTLLTTVGVFGLAALQSAFAEGAAVASPASETTKWLALSSGIGLGIAAFGSALGQGKMVANAMEGIARNPGAAKEMFVPMLLGLAFIEALTIYSLIFVFIWKLAFPA